VAQAPHQWPVPVAYTDGVVRQSPLMSYTQFVGTASCSVVDGFNLQSFLDAISERCVKEENEIFEFYGEIDGKVDVDFADYVRLQDDKILIECDTEESNGNSETWDWLIDQFVPIMTSQFMTIKSSSIDSRSGVGVHVAYVDKESNCMDSESILEQYIKLY
jgi:hypothetical protein